MTGQWRDLAFRTLTIQPETRMNTRFKLLALSAVIAAAWSAAPMAQTAAVPGAAPNPTNQGSSMSGGSGSQVTPRTTGGAAMPSPEQPGLKKPKILTRSSSTTTTTSPAASGSTMGSSSSGGTSTAMSSGGSSGSSAAPAPRRAKKDRG